MVARGWAKPGRGAARSACCGNPVEDEEDGEMEGGRRVGRTLAEAKGMRMEERLLFLFLIKWEIIEHFHGLAWPKERTRL